MSAQTTKVPDPRVVATIALVRQAVDELAATPDEGHTWRAKLALLDAMQWLVKARETGP